MRNCQSVEDTLGSRVSRADRCVPWGRLFCGIWGTSSGPCRAAGHGPPWVSQRDPGFADARPAPEAAGSLGRGSPAVLARARRPARATMSALGGGGSGGRGSGGGGHRRRQPGDEGPGDQGPPKRPRGPGPPRPPDHPPPQYLEQQSATSGDLVCLGHIMIIEAIQGLQQQVAFIVSWLLSSATASSTASAPSPGCPTRSSTSRLPMLPPACPPAATGTYTQTTPSMGMGRSYMPGHMSQQGYGQPSSSSSSSSRFCSWCGSLLVGWAASVPPDECELGACLSSCVAHKAPWWVDEHLLIGTRSFRSTSAEVGAPLGTLSGMPSGLKTL